MTYHLRIISQMLSGNDNVDICTLLEILNKKMKR